jgi:hypothetical protein
MTTRVRDGITGEQGCVDIIWLKVVLRSVKLTHKDLDL